MLYGRLWYDRMNAFQAVMDKEDRPSLRKKDWEIGELMSIYIAGGLGGHGSGGFNDLWISEVPPWGVALGIATSETID
eukprot:Skav228373  [mRNA]  locus=scaffold1981:262921:263612:+ [translate_table: standard]